MSREADVNWVAGLADASERQQIIADVKKNRQAAHALLHAARLEIDLRLWAESLQERSTNDEVSTLEGSMQATPRTTRSHRAPRANRGRRGARRKKTTLPIIVSILLLAVAGIALTGILGQANNSQVSTKQNYSPPATSAMATITATSGSGDWRSGDSIPLAQSIQLATGNNISFHNPHGDHFTLTGPRDQALPKGAAGSFIDSYHAFTLNSGTIQVAAMKRREQPPLVIQTVDSIVSVLGTEFEVAHDQLGTTVKVGSGRVQVEDKRNRTAEVLTTNQQTYIASKQTRRITQRWTVGRRVDQPMGPGTALVPTGAILHAGFGQPDDPQPVLRYTPATKLRITYQATVGCQWMGVWWRNPDAGTTYYVPLGKVTATTGWKTIEVPLNQAEANGQPSHRAPQPGDRICGLRIQTGNGPEAACVIQSVTVLQGK